MTGFKEYGACRLQDVKMGTLEAIADPSCVVPLFSKRVLVHSLSYENEFSFTCR